MEWVRVRVKNNKLNRFIIIGVVILIKLALMGIFSSDYQDKMFIPFVNTFLSGENPYEYYYENQLLSSFPYLPLMLFIESIGGALLALISPTSIFFQNLIFKLPLLLFDLVGYFFILKMGIRFKYATIFYFCSPIILYATYMHGQLDIIPTVLLVVAIYYITNWKKPNNLFYYALFLGLSLSTKFHILAVVPILFFYVATKKNFLSAVKCLAVTITTLLLSVVGFWGTGLIQTVFFNKEQSVLLTVNLDYGATQVLIPILILAIIYLKVYELNYFNKNLLISMMGLLFAVFLICIPPMPAWFIWIVPFVALYFGFVDNAKYKVMVIYLFFNAIYLVYFGFFHRTDYVDIYCLGHSLQGLKISDMAIKNMTFTLLVACLGTVVYKIYCFGIASNSLYIRGNIPFTIGIAGDSGTGKSKLLEKIEHLFGTGKDILFIEGDGDHRWVRNDENWEKYTALDPKANYLYRQAGDINALRRGNFVHRSEYDHDLGIFTDSQKIKPKKYIILCGLHSLYLPQLRKELDLKIYMDTEPELRKLWKIQRDTSQRGYSKEKIVKQIEKRFPDAEKYIYPQRQYADMVITYFDKTLKSCYEENHNVLLSVRLNLNINLNLENIINCFKLYNINLEQTFCADLSRQEIVFDAIDLCGKEIDFEEIAERNIQQYEDWFTYTPEWGTDVEGIIQLFLLILIDNKMRDNCSD